MFLLFFFDDWTKFFSSPAQEDKLQENTQNQNGKLWPWHLVQSWLGWLSYLLWMQVTNPARVLCSQDAHACAPFSVQFNYFCFADSFIITNLNKTTVTYKCLRPQLMKILKLPSLHVDFYFDIHIALKCQQSYIIWARG